jgi:hypothetical protein
MTLADSMGSSQLWLRTGFRMARKRQVRKQVKVGLHTFRSCLTNGKSLFALKSLDQRSAFARRYRDCIASYVSDLGGIDNVSFAEQTLLRRASMLICQLEWQESQFAKDQDGVANPEQLTTYLRALNSLRRVLETLGLQRRPRNITPTVDSYLAASEAAE